MSIEAKNLAMQVAQSGQLNPKTMLVLFFSALEANDEWITYTSVESLAVMADTGERAVMRQLHKLEKSGVLEIKHAPNAGWGWPEDTTIELRLRKSGMESLAVHRGG